MIPNATKPPTTPPTIAAMLDLLSKGAKEVCVCMCVCVCARVHICMCVHVCATTTTKLIHINDFRE